MTLKRLILILLTLLVVFRVSVSLISSWGTPQITDRLQLYQVDLVLHATEFQLESASEGEFSSARNAILGDEPLEAALEQYQSVRSSAQQNLEQFQSQLQTLTTETTTASRADIVSAKATDTSEQLQQVQRSLQQQRSLVNQLDLRIGLIQVTIDKTEAALETWNQVLKRSPEEVLPENAAPETVQNPYNLDMKLASKTARTLIGLWSDPPRIFPEAEPQLQRTLDGWFRYQALTRLYMLQQRSDALETLQVAEQEIAQNTLLKLGLVTTLPLVGFIAGIVLLVGLLVQRLIQGNQAILAQNQDTGWSTPWDWEITWQVLIVGFFFFGQLLLPILLQILLGIGLNFALFGSRASAVSVLISYSLMAGMTSLVLFFSIRSHFPLPEGWFRLRGDRNWILWGIGGYLVALPLMILVSLLNQQIWQGEGGSNPLLQIVLEEKDPISLGIFLFTAAIAAPVFEEFLFRGFLLPSLTRYFPVSGAIALSSLLFAVAHLSPSEVLPLAVLGSVLGVVYTRTRSLLAPMLLHSLWNSVTMAGLFILGSGS